MPLVMKTTYTGRYRPQRRGRWRAVGRGRFVPRPLARRSRIGMYNPTPIFTETADFGSVGIGGGSPTLGQLACQLNSIPQIANYQALYNCARILRVKFMLIPQFTSYAPDPSIAGGTLSVTVPRFVYSIQDTSSVPPPTSELDVLTDNGAKVKLMNKPIYITCRPAPALGESISTGGFASVTKKRQWLTLNASGLTVPHIGVNYAAVCDQPNTANPQSLFNVYAKITFQLRDPK